MVRRELNRRTLLGAGTGLLVTAASGCSFFETAPVEENGTGRAGVKGKQAPMLAELVAKGELPPVGKRLPDSPMIVPTLREVGRYGGTWRSAMITQEDVSWLQYTMGYEPLVRWKPSWTGAPGTSEMLPNVAEEFDVDDEGRVFTFKLRKGMRWSDGEPVTADDLEFAFLDYNVDEEFHPFGIYDLWLSENGEPARFEKLSDYEGRYVYQTPKPAFLKQQCGNVGELVLPKHYLRQFHPKYNDKVDDLVAEAGLSDWLELLDLRRQWWLNAEMPTLTAWVISQPVGEGNAVTAERNPYYWKVDSEGSQLPYLDDYVCEILLDVEVEVLKIQNGELDFQLRNFATVQNKPVIARARESGDYRFVELGPNGVNTFVLALNQTHRDAAKRKMFANKDFRIGLSHAIDRQRIIDGVYGGQGEPHQCAPLKGDALYDEEIATQYLEHDVRLANEYLDRAGYAEKDDEGVRLGEDGQSIRIIALVPSEMKDQVDTLDLIREDWRKVGVDMLIQPLQETLYWERVEAGDVEASTWTGDGFAVDGGQGDNHYYIPTNTRGSSRFGRPWAQWYATEGEDGQRPPADLVRALELHDKMRNTYDPDEALAMGKEVLRISKEWFFYIGISTPPREYGIVKNNFENVPDEMPGEGGFVGPGPTNPEQYFSSES